MKCLIHCLIYLKKSSPPQNKYVMNAVYLLILKTNQSNDILSMCFTQSPSRLKESKDAGLIKVSMNAKTNIPSLSASIKEVDGVSLIPVKILCF